MGGRFERAACLAAVVWLWGGTVPSLAAIIPPRDLSPYRVIQAESAVVRHGDWQGPAPASLYDGTGLTDTNPLLAHHGSDPATIWQYPITADEYPVSLEFDLGGEFLINEMWIWQLQGEGIEAQGLREFDIVMRDAAGREVGLLEGVLEDFKRVGIQPVQRFNAFGECIFLPIPDCVQFVELRIYRNHGDPQWLGLAEVAFAGRKKLPEVPEPRSGWPCLILALASWGRCRRRGRASRRPTGALFERGLS